MADKLDEQLARRNEKQREFNNTPERKEYMRRWMAANKEKRKAYLAAYVQRNKDRHNELGKRWRKNNLEKNREISRATYQRYKDRRLKRSREVYDRDRLTPKSVAKELYGGAFQRAKKRGLEFNLTREWLIEKLIDGRCEVSGLPFERGKGKHHPMSASVDRIRLDGGYTTDNSRVVIWAVNSFKGTGDDATMWSIVDAMVAHRARRRSGDD